MEFELAMQALHHADMMHGCAVNARATFIMATMTLTTFTSDCLTRDADSLDRGWPAKSAEQYTGKQKPADGDTMVR